MGAIRVSWDESRRVQVDVIEQQELVFFIGPGADNPLLTEQDHKRRSQDASELLEPKHGSSSLMAEILGKALDAGLAKCAASVRMGLKRGLCVPTICVDLLATDTDQGTSLSSLITPEATAEVCRELIQVLDTPWVDVWYTGDMGHAQINCDRDGEARLTILGGKSTVIPETLRSQR